MRWLLFKWKCNTNPSPNPLLSIQTNKNHQIIIQRFFNVVVIASIGFFFVTYLRFLFLCIHIYFTNLMDDQDVILQNGAILSIDKNKLKNIWTFSGIVIRCHRPDDHRSNKNGIHPRNSIYIFCGDIKNINKWWTQLITQWNGNDKSDLNSFNWNVSTFYIFYNILFIQWFKS